MANDKTSKTAEGVEDAWAWWLSQHPESVPEIIESAIKKAFSEWLERNKADVIAAIAARKVEL